MLALAASLALFAAFPDAPAAGAGPPEAAGTEPVPPESVPPENLEEPGATEEFFREKAAAAGKIVDQTHAFLERSIFDRVIRFDEFFGNVKAEEARPPGYLLRWRNSVRWDEGGEFKYRTSVRAHVHLPRIGRRLGLIVSGENEAEPSSGLPEDPGNPGFDQTLQNTRLVNAELRYTALRKPTSSLFIGAGVRLVIPLEEFVRTRFQYTRPLGADSLARFAETLFWKDRDGVGETTELTLERRLDPKTLLRWANSGTVSHISKGLEWGTELSVLREFSPRSALSFGGGVFGDTRQPAWVEKFRVFSRYRRNALSPWLFFELEPEVSWPRKDGGGYPPAHALTFRVEVLFQGSIAGEEKKPGPS